MRTIKQFLVVFLTFVALVFSDTFALRLQVRCCLSRPCHIPENALEHTTRRATISRDKENVEMRTGLVATLAVAQAIIPCA